MALKKTLGIFIELCILTPFSLWFENRVLKHWYLYFSTRVKITGVHLSTYTENRNRVLW